MSDLGLIRYDAMCNAIAACYKVDEVKELRNKARALEVYAAQALNKDAERKACEIRIRAERRAGELLKETPKNTGARGVGKSAVGQPDRTPRLKDLGITKEQSSKWQELAEIPAEEFEEALAAPDCKPSTEGILNARRPRVDEPLPVPNDALWLWGTIKDFEREGMFDKDPNVLISRMLDVMQDDMKRLLPRLFSWLSLIGANDGAAEFNSVDGADQISSFDSEEGVTNGSPGEENRSH